MSNSAVLTFDTNSRSPAIYLHWNGDAASVRGFLLAAEELGLGLPDDMGWLEAQESLMDSLAHMIATRFFGCNVGRHVYRCTYGNADIDAGYGVYLIDFGLRIVGRRFQAVPDELDDTRTIEIAQTILRGETA
jgi:hypothetical protein